MFSDYDLIPTLLTALEDASQSKADMAAETLMELVGQLYEEHVHGDENGSRRDPQWALPARGFLPGDFGAAIRPAQAAGSNRGVFALGKFR